VIRRILDRIPAPSSFVSEMWDKVMDFLMEIGIVIRRILDRIPAPSSFVSEMCDKVMDFLMEIGIIF